jgi:hypothetical protein
VSAKCYEEKETKHQSHPEAKEWPEVRLNHFLTCLKYIEKTSEVMLIYNIIYSAISGSQQKGWKY